MKTHTDPFTVGVNGTYALTVQNVGLVNTQGAITVTDVLPVIFGFVSGTGTGWICPRPLGQTVICTNNGPLAPNASTTIALTVSPLTAGSVTNTAMVSDNPGDTNPNGTDKSSSNMTTVNPPGADLSITKSNMGNFTVGVTGTYTLTVTNVGPGATTTTTASPITVTDTLPNGLVFGSFAGVNWNCSASGQIVTCINTFPINPGVSSLLGLGVTVGTAAVPSVTNTARVSDAGDINPNGTDKSSSNMTIVNPAAAPDLSLSMMHTDPFTIGVNGVYTLTVTNIGNADATGPIIVTDTLPAGLAFVSGAGMIGATNWSCAASGQTVTCTNSASLVVGTNSTITLTVLPSTAEMVTNTATVNAPPGDIDNSDKSASNMTTINNPPPTVILERASVQANGAQASQGGGNPSIGSDGKFVAFFSTSPDLLGPGFLIGAFLRQTSLGVPNTTLIHEVGPGSNGSLATCFPNTLSDPVTGGGARFVISTTEGLDPQDKNGAVDLYVIDTSTLVPTLITRAVDGTAAVVGDCGAISADGNFVAFGSSNTNLVQGVSGTQIFVAPVVANTRAELVSVSDAGVPGNATSDARCFSLSNCASISGDGRFVAFSSAATNLVTGVTNGKSQVYLRDRIANPKTTTLVTADPTGAQGDDNSFAAAISPNGRFIALQSFASNLVSAPSTGHTFQFYVRDTCFPAVAGCVLKTILVSQALDGTAGVLTFPGFQTFGSSSVALSVSDNGLVAFETIQPTDPLAISPPLAPPGDSIFVRNICLEAPPPAGCVPYTVIVYLTSTGGLPNDDSFTLFPVISGNGHGLAYQSIASNLVPNDTNNAIDAFVGFSSVGPQRPLPTITSLSQTSATAGSMGFTLTVHGTLFDKGSVVLWNNAGTITQLTTTLVDLQTLNATVPPQLLTTAGTAQVSVFNPPPGGGSSLPQTFTIH
ncbi:MAG: hypothetical protein ACRD50_05700 [Candidatus Acidiferrales bacterium]